ncbi:MAG: pseudouridine synthase [Acutalibacteraceae bacterium]
MAKERIDKVISKIMCVSRSDARRLIKIGKVFLEGERVKAFDTKVDESSDIVVNGKPITYSEKVYIMMNKPQGVVCDDKDAAPYAPSILDEELRRKDLFCVGRLDKDTTGLLIITNDGDFAHKVISPKKHIKKRYRVTLAHALTDENIKTAEKGITLSDGTELLPARIENLSADRKEADFIIEEGKYHQIKRMAGALENKVINLKRISIGSLSLDEDLAEGKAKKLTRKDLDKIFAD